MREPVPFEMLAKSRRKIGTMISAASEYRRLINGSAAEVASKTAAKMVLRPIELQARSSSSQATMPPSRSCFLSTMRGGSARSPTTTRRRSCEETHGKDTRQEEEDAARQLQHSLRVIT